MNSWDELAQLYGFNSPQALRAHVIAKFTLIDQWPISEVIDVLEVHEATFKKEKQPQEIEKASSLEMDVLMDQMDIG